jgi:hypothetical protein
MRLSYVEPLPVGRPWVVWWSADWLVVRASDRSVILWLAPEAQFLGRDDDDVPVG